MSKRTAAAREQAMDEVDVIIAAWERERPDLDVTTVGVVSRVAWAVSQLASTPGGKPTTGWARSSTAVATTMSHVAAVRQHE